MQQENSILNRDVFEESVKQFFLNTKNQHVTAILSTSYLPNIREKDNSLLNEHVQLEFKFHPSKKIISTK